MRTLFVSVFCILFWSPALAEPRVAYVPRLSLDLPAKSDPKTIEVTTERPVRIFVPLGQLNAQGDANTSHDGLIELAVKKALELGADVVYIAKVEERERRQGAQAGGLSVRGIGLFGGGGGNTQDIPRLSAVLGIYPKAALGLTYDEEEQKKRRAVVSGFRSASKAAEAGIKVGDEILEFEGMRMTDPRAQKALATMQPGQTVKLFVKRAEGSSIIEVPLIPND
jgi:hypothetical protein